jgi:hypothetical protein
LPWLAFACAAVPALLLLNVIVQNWINIPFWDEWRLSAELRIALASGTLRLGDLFTQYNDTRFFVPNLVVVPLAQLTHWDLRAEMFATFAATVFLSWLCWSILQRVENLSAHFRLYCFLAINCLLFSPIQAETWLWGINFSLILPPLFLLLALRVNLSAKRLAAKSATSILTCFASTFSNANGMGNWLLAFPGAFSSYRGPLSIWLCRLVYFATGLSALVLFFLGYRFKESFDAVSHQPQRSVAYFFCWLGAPIASNLGSRAWIAGVILLLFFVVLALTVLFPPGGCRRKSELAVAFLAIGAYALLAGAAATVGRSGRQFEWALSSRYTSYSIYLPIAVLCLAALYYQRVSTENHRGSTRRITFVFVLVAIIMSCSLATWPLGYHEMDWTRRQRALGRAALLFSQIIPANPELNILASNPQQIVPRYRALLKCGMAQDPFVSPALISELTPRSDVNRQHGYLKVCQWEGDRVRLKGCAIENNLRPAPFVLFAYREKGKNAIPFGVAPTGIKSSFIRRKSRDCQFQVRLSPPFKNSQAIEISAWAVDPGTREVWQLAQPHFLVPPPLDNVL